MSDWLFKKKSIMMHSNMYVKIGVYTVVKLQIQNTVEWKPISCFLVEGFVPFNGQFLLSKINSLCVTFSLKIFLPQCSKVADPESNIQ